MSGPRYDFVTKDELRAENADLLARVENLTEQRDEARQGKPYTIQMEGVRACKIHAESFKTVEAERNDLRAVVDAAIAEINGWKPDAEDSAAFWRGRVLNALGAAAGAPK